MDKRFFAINKLEPDLVAIFDSEEDRDEWVSFQDAVAREFALPEDQVKWPRLAISEEQAVICSAGKINDPASIFDDDGGQKMRWVYAGYNGKPTVEEIVRKYSTQLQMWGL